MLTGKMTFHVDQQVIFFHNGRWFEGKILESLPPSNYRVVEFAEIIRFQGNAYTIATEQILPMPNHHRLDPTSNHQEASSTASSERTLPQEVLPSNISMMKLSELQEQDLLRIIPHRRPLYHPNHGNGPDTAATVSRLVPSLLPKEWDLRKLGSQAHQNDPSALLQLADAYRFGLLGVVPDRNRALTLYTCAAWGIKELDLEEEEEEQETRTLRFAYPMGTPEAMCAYAIDIGEHEGVVLGPALVTTATMSLAQAMQVVQGHSNPRLQASLAAMMFFVAHSLRRGWIAPLAWELGQALHGNRQAIELFLPDSLYILKILNDGLLFDSEPQWMGAQELDPVAKWPSHSTDR